jgi:hypothetical protein
MDFTQQAEDMIRTWGDVQKRMWEQWLEGTESLLKTSSRAGRQQAMAQAFRSWEQSVARALDAQVEWTRIWADSYANSGTDLGQPAAWADQFSQLMQGWVEMQKQLWHNWFETLAAVGPASATTAWDAMWDAWQTAARQAREMGDSLGASKGAAGPKSTGGSQRA